MDFGTFSINAGEGSRVFELTKPLDQFFSKSFVSCPGFGLLMYGPDFHQIYSHNVLNSNIPPKLWQKLQRLRTKMRASPE
jgi:hypothetical protein